MIRLLTVPLFSLCLLANGVADLPDWAQDAIAHAGAPPPTAKAWGLLTSHEVSYDGEGVSVRLKRRRVVKVLSDEGISVGRFFSGSNHYKTRVKRLKGWNLRPDGQILKVDRKDLFTIDPDAGDQVTTQTHSLANLPAVVKGSVIVFESDELISDQAGPWLPPFSVMSEFPTHLWELKLDRATSQMASNIPGGSLEAHYLAPWIVSASGGGNEIHFLNVPALPEGEAFTPPLRSTLPQVWVKLRELYGQDVLRGSCWDDIALWVSRQYSKRYKCQWPFHDGFGSPMEALAKVHQWMTQTFRYQVLYFSPERGLVPDPAEDILRRRSGDCKDLATAFIGVIQTLGFQGFPVLARIQDGRITADEPVSIYAFNHVIAAVHLEKSLGLPAEFDSPIGRLLLVDLTARLTPLGYLPAAHRDGRVMVCTSDGPIWLVIPDTAIEPSRMSCLLRGELQQGHLDAKMALTEVGDGCGLRNLALKLNEKAVTGMVAKYFALPVQSQLNLIKMGDPLDLSKPFLVECSLKIPSVAQDLGQEIVLPRLGLPHLPNLAQPKDVPRQMPLEIRAWGTWDAEMDLAIEPNYSPLSTAHDLETPFRSIHWQAHLENGRLKGHFHQSIKDVYWDFAHREEGVTAQRKDRSAMKVLMEDIRTLVPAKP